MAVKKKDDTRTVVAKIYTVGPFMLRLTGPNINGLAKKSTKIGESTKMTPREKEEAYDAEVNKVIQPKVRVVDMDMTDDPEASINTLVNLVKDLVPLTNPNHSLGDFGISLDE